MQDFSHDTPLLFGDLLEYLRQQGFMIGIDSHLRLQKVLSRVSGHCGPDELRTLLCPIFACDKKQQEFFYRAFDAYLGLQQINMVPLKDAETVSLHDKAQKPDVTPFWARRWPYFILGLALAAAIALTSYYHERQAQFNHQAAPPRPEASPPTPVPTFLTTLADEPVPELIKPVRWLAAAVPLLSLLLFELYLYKHRNLLINMLRSSSQPYILPLHSDTPAPSIFDRERLYHSARRLRHRQGDKIHLLDVAATIRETAKNLGYPVLRFRRISRTPDYVVLIERASYRDHFSRYIEELMKALEDEGVLLKRYYYEADPRVCFEPFDETYGKSQISTESDKRPSERTVSLKEIVNKHEDSRLVICGSGEGLVDPITGETVEWIRIFGQWKERALLTPVTPREWAARELALSVQFLVLPATLEGLQSLEDYYEFNRTTPLQKRRPQASINTPLDFDSPDILSSLRIYLGERRFHWLCACAIYPSLQWDLTVRIGSLPCLGPNLVAEKSILRLIWLPWFRSGFIPKQLRQMLIKELPPEIYNEVREYIIDMLNQPGQLGMIVDNDINQLAVAIPRSLTILLQDRLRNILNAGFYKRIFRDYVFIQVLESKPSSLGFALPASLSRILYPHGNTALRMNRSLRIILVLLVSLIIWIAAPQIVRAIRTEPTLTVQRITSSAVTSSSAPAPASPTISASETPAPSATTPASSPELHQQAVVPTPTHESTQAPRTLPTPAISRNTESPSLVLIPPTPAITSTPSTNNNPQPSASVPREGTEVTLATEKGQSLQLEPESDAKAICPQVSIREISDQRFKIAITHSFSFSASVTGGKVLQSQQYIWSLRRSKIPTSEPQAIILRGQGSSNISVLWPENSKGTDDLIINVIITGYNVACATEASFKIHREIQTDDGQCGCGACGDVECCPNPGYCIYCGTCGLICCSKP